MSRSKTKLMSILRAVMGIRKMEVFLKPLDAVSEDVSFFDLSTKLFQLEIVTNGIDRLESVDMTGGCVMVANHPRGLLDLFATGAWLSENTTQPVKCMANKIIEMFIPALKPYLVPVDNMGARGQGRSSFNREAFEDAKSFLLSGGVLGVCPAGEVASFRLRSPEGWFRLSDHRWSSSFVGLAFELELPIVPIHVSGRNRMSYYLLRLFGKVFGRLANFRELVASRDDNIVISVGQPLSFEQYKDLAFDDVASRVRENLYAASRGGQ
jgi:putative hemolysin